MTTQGAIPARRGCGTRKEGGLYAEVGLDPNGKSIEWFLIDPPVPVPTEIGLAAQGIKRMTMSDGSLMLLDHVGTEHYKNVADFIEEARRLGVSRRLPRNLDLSGVTTGTRLYLAHERAIIGNAVHYQSQRVVWPSEQEQGWRILHGCPKLLREHMAPEFVGMCAGLWWEDVVDGVASDVAGDDPRIVWREMPSVGYEAAHAPEGVRPYYARGFFMSVPISRLVVVEAQDGSHRGLLAAARKQVAGNIEVEEVQA